MNRQVKINSRNMSIVIEKFALCGPFGRSCDSSKKIGRRKAEIMKKLGAAQDKGSYRNNIIN
jgi:hypothetical protein